MKHHRLFRSAICLLAAAMLAGSALSIAAEGSGTAIQLPATPIAADNRDYPFVTADTQTHTYDFTATDILTYSKDERLANASLRTNMVFDGETLSCKPGKTFSFGSAIFLGDDYGIRGGDLAFDLKQTGGVLSVGLRLSKKAASSDKRGIWFSFDGKGKLTVTSPETSLSATVTGVSTDGRLAFSDKGELLEVFSGEALLCRMHYDAYSGGLRVTGADGQVLSEVASSRVQAAGYFTLYADSMEGHIDNLAFTHTALERTKTANAPVMDYSTWVATDDRDRTTPTGEAVGAPKTDKQVGLFYFVNHTGDASETPKDNTYLYNTLGLDGMKNHLLDKKNAGSHYWAEPYYGYYLNTDSWVQRKHAYMLEAAGVDFIFVDVSNGATYDQALISLFDTWKAIREEGGSTPDICFLANAAINAVWGNIKNYIYDEEGREKYGDLFYEYGGKPLILCDTSKLTAENKAEISELFTVRGCWAWQNRKNGVWNWLQEYEFTDSGKATMVNGGWGLSPSGKREQLALCIGHHPTTSKGRSFWNGNVTYNKDFGFSMDSGAGIGFEKQFEAVKQFDPSMLLITGWNEWTAGLDIGNVKDFAGSHENGFSFVDQFNTEYSRDGEPMKLRDGEGVGFGDNYYYQMAAYIREFKGWNTTPAASGQASIRLDDMAAWENVGPTFTDNAGDAAWRSEEGYFGGYTYVNGSGRNDLVTAKVSQDAEYLYFQVTTRDDLVIADDERWMNLFIDLDGNHTNGWEGFDLAINRVRDGHYAAVESLAGGWEGRHIAQALYTVSGNRMVIRLQKSAVGLEGTATELLFKWADNSTAGGNPMEFMDLGDTAPNDRYAFRYLCAADAAIDQPAFAYKLTVDTRDESIPLPGFEAEDDTTAPGGDTTAPGTDSAPADSTDSPAGGTGSGCSSSLSVPSLPAATLLLSAAFVVMKKRVRG